MSSCRLGIVISRFNEEITKRLLEGAQAAIEEKHLLDVPIYHVPGAFEIPLVAKAMAKSGNFDAIVTLGAVIRGDTAHFEYVCGPMAMGISQVALDTEVPILFGVLTCDTEEQALERSARNTSNKGYEVVLGAIEMVELLKTLRNCSIEKSSQRGGFSKESCNPITNTNAGTQAAQGR